MSLADALHEVTAFFMTKYPVDSPPTVLSDRVESLLLEHYSSEFTSQFISQFLGRVQSLLVEEFNSRFEKPHSLRFRFLDDSGEKIVGIGYTDQHERIEFQNAINELSSYEFETLSAYISNSPVALVIGVLRNRTIRGSMLLVILHSWRELQVSGLQEFRRLSCWCRPSISMPSKLGQRILESLLAHMNLRSTRSIQP